MIFNQLDEYLSSIIQCSYSFIKLLVFGGTKSIFDVCLMKPDPGFCKAYFPRFYYDAAEGRCKKFIYGGCLGNKNNFETVEECELACSSHGNTF